MIFSIQASADHPIALVRPYWRNALASTVMAITKCLITITQFQCFDIPVSG
jgi:hypothetical protein